MDSGPSWGGEASDGTRGWVAEGLGAAAGGAPGLPVPVPPEPMSPEPGAALEGLFALQPATWLRRIPGRETLLLGPRAEVAGLGAALAGSVVKRFGADNPRDRWYERLQRLDPRSPARREAENLAELAAAGFAVPRPLAWFEEPGSRGRSALAMQRVDHEQTLAEHLADPHPATRRAWLSRAAALVARLHTAGWYHRDLYCEHLIVPTGRAALCLLDLGRARRQARPRARWFVKDLAALQHSAPGAPHGVGPRERLRFLVLYARARGLVGRGERRDLARAVLRKAARIARHTPRHADPDSARSLPAQ